MVSYGTCEALPFEVVVCLGFVGTGFALGFAETSNRGSDTTEKERNNGVTPLPQLRSSSPRCADAKGVFWTQDLL